MRAVAVVLVVLFHLRVPGFAAGYLGVDVFFVLSGFLITSLLIAEMERTGRIALADFWSRRVRRLLPALALLLLVVALVTWLSATYSERASIRTDLLAATAYLANWRFIATSSYFVNTGVESPLQHTWSLAIEEQFYLLWPLVLAGALAAFHRARLNVTVIAAFGVIASAVTMAWLFGAGGVERAYMGTDARIFEPLVGALGAVWVATPRSRSWLERTWPPDPLDRGARGAGGPGRDPSRRCLLFRRRGLGVLGGHAHDRGAPVGGSRQRRGGRARGQAGGVDRADLLRHLPLALAADRVARGAFRRGAARGAPGGHGRGAHRRDLRVLLLPGGAPDPHGPAAGCAQDPPSAGGPPGPRPGRRPRRPVARGVRIRGGDPRAAARRRHARAHAHGRLGAAASGVGVRARDLAEGMARGLRRAGRLPGHGGDERQGQR